MCPYSVVQLGFRTWDINPKGREKLFSYKDGSAILLKDFRGNTSPCQQLISLSLVVANLLLWPDRCNYKKNINSTLVLPDPPKTCRQLTQLYYVQSNYAYKSQLLLILAQRKTTGFTSASSIRDMSPLIQLLSPCNFYSHSVIFWGTRFLTIRL